MGVGGPGGGAFRGAIGRMPPPGVLAPTMLKALTDRGGDPADAAERMARSTGVSIVRGLSPEAMAAIKGVLA